MSTSRQARAASRTAVCVANPWEVVVTGQLPKLGARDALGHVIRRLAGDGLQAPNQVIERAGTRRLVKTRPACTSGARRGGG
ncbi:MAG TPA: hypothetical protein VNN07_11380 [Candidatus Tectomicrobia bacterium]|nr:hypothetical protein [Candidatus Tectomicrobia bacterium]